MHLTSQDKKAAREGFAYVVLRGGKRVCYASTLAEAKRECGKVGKVVAISGMSYAAKNPRKRRNPSSAQHLFRGKERYSDAEREYYGRNEAGAARLAYQAESDFADAHDSHWMKFSKQLGDEALSSVKGKKRNPSAAEVGHSVGKHAKFAARGAKKVGQKAWAGTKSFFGSAYSSFKKHNPSSDAAVLSPPWDLDKKKSAEGWIASIRLYVLDSAAGSVDRKNRIEKAERALRYGGFVTRGRAIAKVYEAAAKQIRELASTVQNPRKYTQRDSRGVSHDFTHDTYPKSLFPWGVYYKKTLPASHGEPSMVVDGTLPFMTEADARKWAKSSRVAKSGYFGFRVFQR